MTNFQDLKIGTKLYYTDSKEYFGTIIKVLKRDVHIELKDGKILKNWQKSFAIQMLLKNK